MASSLTPNPTDINLLSHFLSHPQTSPHDLSLITVDCVTICVSAVFHPAETLFSALRSRPSLTRTLVLCGGIGHSTPFLYDAVARHPRYHVLASETKGLPESRVLSLIFERFFAGHALVAAGLTLLIEDQSTNCGANALETRRVLEASGVPAPESVLVVQDPTMSLRTVASFQRAFADVASPPAFLACPTFVPEMEVARGGGELVFCSGGVEAKGLWESSRFLELIMGEIPRLRDDEQGYGPRGKGFIAHVEVPGEVEEAWGRLNEVFGGIGRS
jgi:uncharacterized SAM-binding protein YcdF (DUF218 family)